MKKLLVFTVIILYSQIGLAQLLTKLENYGNAISSYENSISCLLRAETKLSKTVKKNDELVLALEAILNHFKIETLVESQELNFRKKNIKYLTVTLLSQKQQHIDLLFPRLKEHKLGPDHLDLVVTKLSGLQLNATSATPQSQLLIDKATKSPNLFLNRYQASMFTEKVISPTPKYNNYLDLSDFFSLVAEIYQRAQKLAANSNDLPARIHKEIKTIRERLQQSYRLTSDIQRLSSNFSSVAKKLSLSDRIDLKGHWSINNHEIKIVDDDQRALFSYIDKNKQKDIDALKKLSQTIEKWLLKNDLFELLGNGKWMQTGPDDLVQTSNHKQFLVHYGEVIEAQKKLLRSVYLQQDKLNKLSQKIQGEYSHLWQRLAQIDQAIQDNRPNLVSDYLVQLGDDMRLFKELLTASI